MNLNKIRTLVGILINLTILGLEAYCIYTFIDLTVRGVANRFMFYTNISNTAIGVISLINLVFLIKMFVKNNNEYPQVLSLIKYIGITMTTLTFFVILFTIPIYGLDRAYGKDKIITHLIAPILVAISFLFFEEKTEFKWKYTLLALLPTFIYTIVYVTNVVFLKTWKDIYSVNKQGLWYVFVLVALVSDFLLSQGLYFIKRRTHKKALEEEQSHTR